MQLQLSVTFSLGQTQWGIKFVELCKLFSDNQDRTCFPTAVLYALVTIAMFACFVGSSLFQSVGAEVKSQGQGSVPKPSSMSETTILLLVDAKLAESFQSSIGPQRIFPDLSNRNSNVCANGQLFDGGHERYFRDHILVDASTALVSRRTEIP